MLTYPQNVYDKGRTLLTQISSFWNSVFSDKDRLNTLYQGYMLEAGQAYLRFIETMSTASRYDCPVFSKDNWYHLVISEKELTTDINKYQVDNLFYGDGRSYGVRAESNKYIIPAPEGFRGTRFLFNRIIMPSLTYSAGVDFEYSTDKHEITFSVNPFESEYVAIRNIVDDKGNLIDREIGLWAFNTDFDLDYLWTHFGYTLGIKLESSTYYKSFLNSLFDAFVGGPTVKSVQQLIEAISGLPLVIEPVEHVQEVLQYQDKKQVVTDKNVYTYSGTSSITVLEGDTVYSGMSLTDSLSIIEVFSGLPDATTLPGIALGTNFLQGAYQGDLVFENKNVPLQYTTDSEGRAMVTFEVSGYNKDIEKFWDSVHARGVTDGKTLAEYLDSREEYEGEPLPQFMPSQINPLEFILKNLMFNNLYVIKIKAQDIPIGAPGVEWFSLLRRITPPHTTFIVYIEFSPEDTYINMSVNQEEVLLVDVNSEEEEITADNISESIILTEVFSCD